VLTFRIGLSDKNYPPEKAAQFLDQIFTRFNALPGAKSSTAAFPLPFSGGNMSITFEIQGQPTKRSTQPAAFASIVEPAYFETLQIAPLHGRVISAYDELEAAPPVIVINEAFAQKFFPGGDAIGKRIQTGFDNPGDGKPGIWREVVGVVPDTKRNSLADKPMPAYYVPYQQAPVATPYIALRVAGDPTSYEHAVALAVADIDKQVPVYRFRTMQEGVASATSQPRFQALLLTAFAAVALLLAAIGLYAVLSYMVAQRTHEIGLRMALGAARADILSMIMRRGLNLAVAGLAIGIAVSVGLTRLLSGLLYGVKPLDPLTFLAVAGVLLVVSAIASVIPATRAANMEPMNTLRNQ
jgi:predicted permease